MVSEFKDHTSQIRACWLSPDGATAATAGNDETVRVWDAKAGKGIRVIKPEFGSLNALEVTPDGKYLVTSGRATGVFDVQTGAKVAPIEPACGMLVLIPDGKHVVTGQVDGNLFMYELQTGKRVKIFSGQRSVIDHLSVSADGKRLLSDAQNGSVFVWDVATGRPLAALQAPGGFGATKLSADGSCFATAKDGTEHSYYELPLK
jgi:WD40 repeat protein